MEFTWMAKFSRCCDKFAFFSEKVKSFKQRRLKCKHRIRESRLSDEKHFIILLSRGVVTASHHQFMGTK